MVVVVSLVLQAARLRARVVRRVALRIFLPVRGEVWVDMKDSLIGKVDKGGAGGRKTVSLRGGSVARNGKGTEESSGMKVWK
ncbi:hypothetical protein GCM10010840_24640 [Deinococcus aerolatus]|uniref:Secreted protein n=1 Tax=Deinococcus aerolatus TaxID=522487 RepID=A0ABQ2GCJ4_9DEIO|nr:hypothetical protein GCM10010840_24640 [Deinococcus aerolatus]